MNIKYMVTHCYRKDYDDERWDVIGIFDKVEDAIHYHEEQSEYIGDGFLFIDIEWDRE